MTAIIVETASAKLRFGLDQPPNALVPAPICVLESRPIDDGQREVAGRRR